MSLFLKYFSKYANIYLICLHNTNEPTQVLTMRKHTQAIQPQNLSVREPGVGKMNARGEIRVGRTPNTKGPHPSFSGFKRIVCLMASSAYGDISPYAVKDEKGRIIENLWQFSKYYANVPSSVQRYSRFDRRIIWQHPAECHQSDGAPNEAYLAWRKKGMSNNDAVRYPVGFSSRNECICAFKEGEDGPDLSRPLGYIAARKEIYLPEYTKAVINTDKFRVLKSMLDKGENLLIIEVDGPHQESLSYYRGEYGVGDDFIVDDTVLVTPENMEILLNDDRHNFGHGYCLAMALLDMHHDFIL